MTDVESGRPVGPDEVATKELEALRYDLWGTALEAMNCGPREKGLGRLRPSDCQGQYFEILRDVAIPMLDHVAERWLASGKPPLAGLEETRRYAETGLIEFLTAEYDSHASVFHADSEKAKRQILKQISHAARKRLAFWEARFMKAHAKRLKSELDGSGSRPGTPGQESGPLPETAYNRTPDHQSGSTDSARRILREGGEKILGADASDGVAQPNCATGGSRKRGIGSPQAVEAVKAYLYRKGLSLTRFSAHAGSDERTIRRFLKRGSMQRSNFELMANAMGLTVEQLLAGELSVPPNLR